MSTAAPPVDLRPDHLEIVRDILRRHVPDRKVLAFGSRATWTAKQYSDLDLAILGDEPLPLGVTAAMADDFGESDLPFKVDLVDWARLDESFRDIVRRDLVTVQVPAGGSKCLSMVHELVPLSDVAKIVGGGTPSTRDDSNYNGTIPWITPKDLSTHSERYIERGERNITDKGLISSSAKMLPANSVLFSSRAPIGYVAIAKNELCTNQGFKSLVLNEGQVPEFYYYLLKFHTPQIESLASGSTFKEISGSALKSMKFAIPDEKCQKGIAHILGTLDEKIELNHRMNETLEAQAQTIFKDWFVDFAPTRAKMEGRDPGLPWPFADIFPTRLVNSELGEIPEGWRLSRLGAEVDTVLGGTPSRAEPGYWGGDIPWINSGKVNEFRVVEPSEFITREGLASSATKLVPSRTTIIATTGATLGQISLTEIDTCVNQSVVGVIGTDSLPSEYLYFWTRGYINDLLAWQTGGAQQHINKKNVNDLPVVCPDFPVIEAYLANVRPIFVQIRSRCLESRALAALRDILLPKLISGELRVAETKELLQCIEGSSLVGSTST